MHTLKHWLVFPSVGGSWLLHCSRSPEFSLISNRTRCSVWHFRWSGHHRTCGKEQSCRQDSKRFVLCASCSCRCRRKWSLVEQAGLVGGDHVLDVDEGVLAAVAFERLESLRDQVPDVLALLLAVVDPVARVHCKQTNRTSTGANAEKTERMNFSFCNRENIVAVASVTFGLFGKTNEFKTTSSALCNWRFAVLWPQDFSDKVLVRFFHSHWRTRMGQRDKLNRERNTNSTPLCKVMLLTVSSFEDVENGKDLSVVRHERFSDHVGRDNQMLEYFQCSADDWRVPRVQGVWSTRTKQTYWLDVGKEQLCESFCTFKAQQTEIDERDPLTFDGNDELWYDWKNFVSPVFKHVMNTLSREKLVRVFRLTKSVEEQRQVMVVIKLFNFHLDKNGVLWGTCSKKTFALSTLVWAAWQRFYALGGCWVVCRKLNNTELYTYRSVCVYTHLPCNFVAFCVVFQGNWEVSPFVEFSERRWLYWSSWKRPCAWWSNFLRKNLHLTRKRQLWWDVSEIWIGQLTWNCWCPPFI